MIRLDDNRIKMGTNLEGSLSLQHLRLELARIDCFVMQLAYRWRRAGQDPLEAFRGLYISDDEVKGLLNRSFASNWGATAELDTDEEVAFKQAHMSAQEQVEKLRKSAREGGNRLLFDDFVQSFGLDDFERDVILICLAPTLDLRYERYMAIFRTMLAVRDQLSTLL